MSISELHLNSFKEAFVGNQHNYGQHYYSFEDDSVKEKGKNKTVTDTLLTIAQYKAHLEGKTGLGLIPLTEDDKCRFAVLDIDIYDKDFSPYLMAIDKNNLPLVPFKSKSGGYHLYLFLKQPAKAKDVRERMYNMARMLGITIFIKQHLNKSVEIFPKQDKTDATKPGNWINLPYFNALDTKQGLIKDGKMLSLNDALIEIKTKQILLSELDELLAELPYNDAPPCLQTLYLTRILNANSGRNNFLFSFGVYLKKKDENYFEQNLWSINNMLKDPLEIEEIEATILSSLRRKDYTYKCKESPCCDFCDKKICQEREYGIGKQGGYFTTLIFGRLVQFKTLAPYYEWEVRSQDTDKFSTLRFRNEDEIIQQDAFLRLCFRELHFLPFKMKQVEWFKLVNQALNDLIIVDVDRAEDTSPVVRFQNAFLEFLTGRALATTLGQILMKRVYFDSGTEAYLFRPKDFLEYLYEVKNFRLFNSSEVHGLLRDMGAYQKVIRDEAKRQLRLMAVKQDKIQTEMPLTEQAYEVDFSDYEEEEQF